MIRCLLGVLGAALACVALLGASALAETVTEVPTSVTFSNPESGVYLGTVNSKRAACRNGRRVTIIEDRNLNGRSDHADRILARTTSNGNGAYTAKGDQARRGDRLLVVVGVKILARAAFCRSFVKTATAGSG